MSMQSEEEVAKLKRQHRATAHRMTVAKVQARVRDIEIVKGDYEAAHSMEDELHQDVLKAIAEGRINKPKECAAEALKTLKINFARHCS